MTLKGAHEVNCIYQLVTKYKTIADDERNSHYFLSFALIAKANSQARRENFHPIAIFESTRCKLASWLLR